MIAKLFLSFKKSPLLAFIKFESAFLTGSLAVCLSAPVQGEAGGRGGIPVPSKFSVVEARFSPAGMAERVGFEPTIPFRI